MSWSPSRWIAVTVLCLWVLGADVYSGFQPVRLKLVTAPLPSQQFVLLPLTGVEQIREPFVVIVCRLRNEGDAPVRVSARVDDELLRRISLSPRSSARVDLVWAPRTRLPEAHRLGLISSSTQWTVQYTEVANLHGLTRGVVTFLILPAGQPFTPAPRWSLLACCGWAWFMWRRRRPLWPRRVRRAHLVLSLAVAVLFVLTAVSGLASPYRIVMSTYTFALGLAVLSAPQIF